MRIYLQKTTEEDESPRFYQLILQPDLLGGATLIRQWGRQGQRGSHKRMQYPSLQEAQQELERIRQDLQHQGYQATFIQGMN